MTLDARYVVTSDVDTYFVNKDTGQALSNGQLIFYRDSARNVPKAVFELSGAPPSYTYTSMGAIVQLSNSGTVMDSQGANQVIYYYPYITDPSTGKEVLDLYYVVCEDANGVIQFTREAWPNLADSTVSPTQETSPLNNQISNPTFTNIFISDNTPMTISVSGAFEQRIPIAPDWDLVLTGSGQVIVQRIAISGFDTVTTNPPYVLDISIGVGITTFLLSQKFNYNSGLWSSVTGNLVYLTGSLIAQNQVGGTTTIQMFYKQSGGTLSSSPIQILSGTVTGAYSIIQGGTTSSIPSSNDPNAGVDGFIEIYLLLPVNTHMRISSVELIPSFAAAQTIPYNLDSSNRAEAYQGDYYLPRLSNRPINSYLVGWDFPQSPFQFGTGGSINPGPLYISDQTICGHGVVGITNFVKDPNTRGLRLTGNSQAVYILQYLQGFIVNGNITMSLSEIINNRLSVNVFGYSVINATTSVQVRLYRCGAGGSIPAGTAGAPGVIGNVNADGSFNLTAANWFEIPRSGLGTAQANLSLVTTQDQVINGKNDYGFNGWQVTDLNQLSDTTNIAIVVSIAPFSTCVIQSVSLVPGDIPCRPAYKSYSETLLDCQYYFNKSFIGSTAAAQGIGLGSGESYGVQSKGSNASAIGSIINFETPMRTAPTVTFYNPVSSNALMRNVTTSNDWQTTTPLNPSSNGFVATGTTQSGGGSAIGDTAAVHWTADARLGVIS